jgi:hypothetical protein
VARFTASPLSAVVLVRIYLEGGGRRINVNIRDIPN